MKITTEEAQEYLDSHWKDASEIKVDSSRVDSEGITNVWAEWIAEITDDEGTVHRMELSQNIKMKRTATGAIMLL